MTRPGRKKILWIFVALMALASFISFSGYLFDFALHHKLPVGIVIANPTTQAMYFVAAAFMCLIMANFTKQRTPWLIMAIAAILICNIILVTPSKSGYLALIVLMVLIVFWRAKGKTRLFLALAVPILLIAVLTLLPTPRNPIEKGFDEIKNHETDPIITSMDTRIVFWKNTLEILKEMEHPLIGYGTDGFKIPYSRQVQGQEGWQGVVSSDPHNQYLKILAQRTRLWVAPKRGLVCLAS